MKIALFYLLASMAIVWINKERISDDFEVMLECINIAISLVLYILSDIKDTLFDSWVLMLSKFDSKEYNKIFGSHRHDNDNVNYT